MIFLLQNKFRKFCDEWEIPQPKNKQDEDRIFEDFSNYYVLGSQGEYPKNYYTFSTHQGTDHGIDGIIIKVNGVVCASMYSLMNFSSNASVIT